MNANNFFKYCCGIALVAGTLLFGSAALIYTTAPAHADAPTITNSTGKYMMNISAIVDSRDETSWIVLVWNTETGKSKIYVGGSVGQGTDAAPSSYYLPSSPL